MREGETAGQSPTKCWLQPSVPFVDRLFFCSSSFLVSKIATVSQEQKAVTKHLAAVAAESCSTDGQVRLDGPTANEGRVEICLDGDWGTICDHHWGSSEARIVCQQLGLPAERK